MGHLTAFSDAILFIYLISNDIQVLARSTKNTEDNTTANFSTYLTLLWTKSLFVHVSI